MAEIVVIAGTGTEVGKTWVGCRLIEEAVKRSSPVTARKPVQSFDIEGGPTDADLLAEALGVDAAEVCPLHRWYELPLAPPIAAESLGLPPIALADLVEEMRVPELGLCLVEGVGGPRSPLSDDADTIDLVEALDAALVVLVARPGLGTINDVILSLGAFEDRDVAVFLNRFDPSDDTHQTNKRWLREAEGIAAHIDVGSLFRRVQRVARSTMEVR